MRSHDLFDYLWYWMLVIFFSSSYSRINFFYVSFFRINHRLAFEYHLYIFSSVNLQLKKKTRWEACSHSSENRNHSKERKKIFSGNPDVFAWISSLFINNDISNEMYLQKLCRCAIIDLRITRKLFTDFSFLYWATYVCIRIALLCYDYKNVNMCYNWFD